MKTIGRFLGGVIASAFRAVLIVALLAGGVALANYTMTQGAGTTFASVVISTVHYAAQVICDATNGVSNCAAVKAGNTGAAADQAVAVYDANLLAATQGATPAGANRIGFMTLQTDTTGGATSFHALSAANNNSTSVKGSAGTVYSLTITQTTTTLGDFRFYDSASAPTCSSATGVIDNYAVQSNATSPGMHLVFPYGKAFANGIGFCLTGAVSDSDNTNFVTGVQINIEWK